MILDFFNSVHYSRFKVNQICIVHSLEHREFRSVGMSKLPCKVPELQAFIFVIFLIVLSTAQ